MGAIPCFSLALFLHPPYTPRMAPTLLRDGGFRLFFFSREEPRIHVHVSHADGEAKYWLEPKIELAQSFGLSAPQLRQAAYLVTTHETRIRNAWLEHFAG